MRSGYKETKYPEKSWSVSRIKTLNNCEREYYHTYYGFHNGWNYESTEEAKITWRLKKLTNLWMIFGSILHDEISGIIKVYKAKGVKFMSADRLRHIVLERLRAVVRESKNKYTTNEWNEYPRGEMLQEYYYGNEISKETGKELTDKVIECVNNFYISKTVDILLNTKAIIIESDDDGFTSFNYNGVKMYSMLDLLYIDSDGYYTIVDWKTGKYSEEDKEQLLVYAWYVYETHRIPFSRIKGRLEYLSTGEFEEVIFGEEDFNFIKERVDRDFKRINFYLEDIDANKPKEKEEFYKTEATFKCSSCNYRLLCLNEKID